ncbi:MAG: DUF3972 domain-containing protein [Campylobacterota bacterium]
MSKLVKPAEYAVTSGLSRQAIYAQMKNGTLLSKKVSGRLYVVVDEQDQEQEPQEESVDRLKDIIASKDETIKVLQTAIDDLKSSNEGVIQTLQSEISLLKQAFAEMRGVYKEAITYKPRHSLDSKTTQDNQWRSIKKYCKAYDVKLTKEFEKEIKKLYKQGSTKIKKKKDKYYISGSLHD